MNKILYKLGLQSESPCFEGEVVDLRERRRISEAEAYDGVPTVYYDIYLHDSDIKVGKCDLRLKIDERMYYYGHIGYSILPKWRGHSYAYYACLIMFRLAKEEFGLKELIVTCNPDNVPSYKTLRKLGGELLAVVPIPKNHELYYYGDRHKCIFRYKIALE